MPEGSGKTRPRASNTHGRGRSLRSCNAPGDSAGTVVPLCSATGEALRALPAGPLGGGQGRREEPLGTRLALENPKHGRQNQVTNLAAWSQTFGDAHFQPSPACALQTER